MEFSLVFLALAVWFLVSAVSRGGRRPPPAGRQERPVESMLRHLQRALEEAEAAQRRTRLPPPKRAEPSEFLVREPVNPDEAMTRGDQQPVDLDDEAEKIAARRIASVAAREQGRAAEPPSAVPDQIRRQPADHTATPPLSRQRLRDAVVWREILGPPVSER
jgi:hypothetical protein